MAISVSTPKNLRQVKPKFIGNFTKRQVFSLGAAALIGFPLYFLSKGSLGSDMAALLMVLAIMPCMLFITENLKYGLPAEKLLLLIWKHGRLPGIRPYKAENLLKQLEEREKIKKEVQFLEEKARNGRKGKNKDKEKTAGKKAAG